MGISCRRQASGLGSREESDFGLTSRSGFRVATVLILLGAAAVFGTGAATIGKGVPPTHHRRLLDNIFTTKASLKTAVQAYNADVASAEATYGPVANWDVSGITDMSELFYYLKNFDADISSWHTSGVTNMRNMFGVRSIHACPVPSTSGWTHPLHAACA